MKLQKLTIHNIASIEDAEIEFDKGALAEDPLFLITGRTGAGKTTILNAICLALYNEVPCLTDVQDDRTSDEGLRISSPAQLMRKGSKKAEVTLTFQCGEVGYTAVWEAHYSNRKTKDAYRKLLLSRSLTNNATGETLSKKTEINDEICAAVGLTFEQFTRTTMLAQGQFAAFMSAEEKDKADILEKLTGTEIYTRIGQKIFELMKEAEALHSCLSADISEIKLFGDEQIAEIEENIRTLTAVATTDSLRIAVLDKQLEWLRGYERLQKSHEQTRSEYDKLTAIAAGHTHREKISGIERYDSTAEIRTRIRRRAEIQKQIAVLSADRDNYKQEKAHKIADGLCHIQKIIADAQDRYQRLTAECGEMEPMSRVYADIQRIEEKASQLKSLIEKYSATEALLKETEKALTRSLKAETPLKESIDAIDKEMAEFDTILKNINSSLAGYDMSALTSGKNAVDKEILKIKLIMQLHETLCSRRSDLEETVKRAGDTAKNLKTAKKEIGEIELQIPLLTIDYEKCRAFLDGQKTLADHIGQLRGLYAESHVCPLCGNTHAQMLADDTINLMLDEAKKNFDEANKALVDAQVRQKSMRKEITTIIKRIEELNDEESRKRKLVDSTISDLKVNGCADPDEIIPEKLKLECSYLEKKSEDYEKIIREVDSLRARREDVSRKREKSADKKGATEKKLHKQQQETVRLTEKRDQQQELLKEGKKDIEAALGQLVDMTGTQLTIGQFEIVVEKLKKESEHYSLLKESLVRCEKEIADMRKLLSNCNDLIPDAFRIFIEGYSPRPKELVTPEVKISEYGNTLSRLTGEISTCENQYDQLNKEIDTFFEDGSFTRNEVDDIDRISEDTVLLWRSELKEFAEKLTRAEGALTVVNRQIADHNETKPEIAEEASIESLSSEKEQIEKKRDAAKEEKSGLVNRLNENERLNKTYKERVAQREESAVQLNEWKLLNTVFGSADGARFRAIAQSYVLRALLVRANTYLSWLSSRYTLVCKDGSLAINVVDLVHGNSIRNVSSLSGGESFVVSLALALGLSAISKDKIDVDILFIDEGFGTLDHDTLETVIETLDSLHRRGGRRIGIISHVAQLAERIPTQIRLVPAGPNLSRVVIA